MTSTLYFFLVASMCPILLPGPVFFQNSEMLFQFFRLTRIVPLGLSTGTHQWPPLVSSFIAARQYWSCYRSTAAISIAFFCILIASAPPVTEAYSLVTTSSRSLVDGFLRCLVFPNALVKVLIFNARCQCRSPFLHHPAHHCQRASLVGGDGSWRYSPGSHDLTSLCAFT